VQEFQCPGEPENVFKGDDKEDLPKGMVRALRVLTGKPKGDPAGLLDTQMAIVINFYFQYAIDDIFDFVSNFAGQTSEIERQLRDVGESTISGIAAKETPETFNDKQSEINDTLLKEVRKRFRNSGVRIISARLISPDVSHDVSKALSGIPIKRAEAQQTVITAEAEKARLTKVGEGAAAAEFALLKAQAEGRKAIMEALEVGGDSVLSAEAVRALSSKTDVLMAGAEGGMRDMIGLVKGAQSALNLKPKATEGVTS
jgi:regulator of protease activity HflC (stomatin/prohibitin superfamily)